MVVPAKKRVGDGVARNQTAPPVSGNDDGYSLVSKGEVQMTVERYLRLVAGCFVLATVLLGYFHSPYWFLFTGFVAINLIQSAFTNWCPMISFLLWLGAKSDAASVSRSSEV